MKIVYQIQASGKATDLKFEADDYIAGNNENVIGGDKLPDIEILHSTYFKNASHAEKIKKERQKAYTEEADPLFFEWQRGEITKDIWLNKIVEIKARYLKV